MNEGSNISVCLVVENPPSMMIGFHSPFKIIVQSTNGTARGVSFYIVYGRYGAREERGRDSV